MQMSGTGSRPSIVFFCSGFVCAALAVFCCLGILAPRSALANDPPMVRDNLFSPDRIKPVAPVLVPERQPDTPPAPKALSPVEKAVAVNGIFVFGETRRALLKVSTSLVSMEERQRQSPSMWVSPGDAVGDYMVREVGEENVVLAHGEESFTIPIDYKTTASNDQAGNPWAAKKDGKAATTITTISESSSLDGPPDDDSGLLTVTPPSEFSEPPSDDSHLLQVAPIPESEHADDSEMLKETPFPEDEPKKQ